MTYLSIPRIYGRLRGGSNSLELLSKRNFTTSPNSPLKEIMAGFSIETSPKTSAKIIDHSTVLQAGQIRYLRFKSI